MRGISSAKGHHLDMEFEPTPLPETLFWRYRDEEVVQRARVLELEFTAGRFVLLHLLDFLD